MSWSLRRLLTERRGRGSCGTSELWRLRLSTAHTAMTDREERLVHRAIGGLATMLMFQGLAYAPDASGSPVGSAVAPQPSDAYLAPGRGLPAQQIEGIYHHWNWMMMLNAGMIDTGADYLFKNGKVWRHPQLPPEDVDITKAKRVSSADWGSWQRTASVIAIRMPGRRDESYDPAHFVCFVVVLFFF